MKPTLKVLAFPVVLALLLLSGEVRGRAVAEGEQGLDNHAEAILEKLEVSEVGDDDNPCIHKGRFWDIDVRKVANYFT